MSDRAEDPRLKEIRDAGHEIYSISRLDTINNCLLSAYKIYRLGDKGSDNVYSSAGGAIHDCLEKIMNNEATESDLITAIQQEITMWGILGMEFPKDRNGLDTIRENWLENIGHFCHTYKRPVAGKYITEELVIYKTSHGHYIQGYIDLQRIRDDGSIDILDYKTSSMYNKSAMKEHGRQLVLYAMAKMQEGKKVNSISWVFLKYADIYWNGGKLKTVERRKIAITIMQSVAMEMRKKGYSELDIELETDKFKKTNMLTSLPKDIQESFKILPSVVKYELSDETIAETEEYLNNTIEMWENLGDDISEYPHRNFQKRQKNGKLVDDIFFCTSLCNHKMCPAIKDYINSKTNEEEGDDLF